MGEKFFMPAEWDILWLKVALVAVITFLCFISKYPIFIALRCVMGYFLLHLGGLFHFYTLLPRLILKISHGVKNFLCLLNGIFYG